MYVENRCVLECVFEKRISEANTQLNLTHIIVCKHDDFLHILHMIDH